MGLISWTQHAIFRFLRIGACISSSFGCTSGPRIFFFFFHSPVHRYLNHFHSAIMYVARMNILPAFVELNLFGRYLGVGSVGPMVKFLLNLSRFWRKEGGDGFT